MPLLVQKLINFTYNKLNNFTNNQNPTKMKTNNWFIKFLLCDRIFKIDGKPRKLKKQFLPLWWSTIILALIGLGFFGYYFCKAWMWMVDFVNYVVWGMMPPVW